MPIPEELWQWPVVAVLGLVIGWLLWTQREERRRYEERMSRLLDSAEADRQTHLQAWNVLVREQVGSQHEMVAALAKLCLEVDRLSESMQEQHEEIMARWANGKAEG